MAVYQPFLRKTFPYFKWTVFGLLGINVILFAIEINVLEFEEEIPYRDVPDGDAATVAAAPSVGPGSEEV